MSLTKRLKNPQTQDRLVFLILAISLAMPFIQPLALPLTVSAPTLKFYGTVQGVPKGGVIVVDEALPLISWYECGPGEIAFYNQAFKMAKENGAKVVFLSTNFQADSPVIQDRILSQYVDTKSLKYGEDWAWLGWNPAFEAAQAGVVRDLHKTFPVDHYGTSVDQIPMMKNIRDIKDYSLLFFSTSTDGTSWMRQWSELAKTNKVPIIMNAISGTIPAVMPFVNSGLLTAYLNSVAGGAEYEKLLGTPGMGMSFTDALSLAHLYAVALIVGAVVWFGISKVRR